MPDFLALDLRVQLTVIALLGAMVLAAAIGIRLRAGAVLLGLLSFVWLTVDSDFEGRVLFAVTSHNGLTASDLVAVAGLIVASGLLVRPHRARRTHCSQEALQSCALHKASPQ